MLLKFYMCRNRPGIVPMLATSFQLPDHNPIVSHFARHTMWFICIDIFKIVNWNEPWVLKYTIIHHFLESGTRILSWIYEVISYVIICIFFFFLHVVHAIHKVYNSKKSAASQWKHATIHIACQPVSCKIILSLIVIFVVWNILTLN